MFANLRPYPFGIIGDNRPLAGVDTRVRYVAAMPLDGVDVEPTVVVGQGDDADAESGCPIDAYR